MSAEDWKERLERSRKAKVAAQSFLINSGLYSHLQLDDEHNKEIEGHLSNATVGVFDCYCTGCKKVTPFICKDEEVKDRGGVLRDGSRSWHKPELWALTAICQRDETAYVYVLKKESHRLTKIGQFPSVASISFGELNGIDKGLNQQDRRELGKALGLFAHDAAAGAFVYLRRVFERMIKRAHERDGGEITVEFDVMRMDEKIETVKHLLPQRVVKNKQVFGLLSRGVHELSDEQCRSIFPVVKAVIFEMLEHEEYQRRRQAIEKETDAALQAALSSGLGASEQG